ncbi:DegT/DnrJ/EryC1/StrS family aminotransferase [Fervidobacterium changbaicum]|uniref:DegT/DnrJ/EryC1/StrS family aminotransferase n=1 Tax=Fervidobacterium changbaicum TaxID=310769 RepID=A0ABX5QU39_9BACT|nr:DegT/DnrJ/EryC1/StrS family aminotransferase [Fervidobacterium changbaicum]
MVFKYPLTDDTWGNEELEAINRVIRSRRFTMGPEVEAFESEFARKFGVKHAVMVNSGSSANLIAIAALIYSGRLNRGDEVIVPAVSWSTTYFPLQQYGLKVKFVDIDRNTLNIDLEEVKDAITEKTKAIFAVNLLGNPNEFDKLLKLCKENDIILLEDNCEAMGAVYKGRYTGTIGFIGTFSMFYSHHISTMEGGVAVTNDEELYHYMLAIRAHGWTRNLPKNSAIYRKSDNEFYESFNFIVPGYNLRPLEIEAAIGREQLKKLDRFIEQRRRNAEYFKGRMKELKGFSIQQEVEKSSWFGFAIILDRENKGKRDSIVKFLQENQIEVRPIVAGNFTRNAAIRYFDYEIHSELINADYIHENGFFVGNHSRDLTKEIDMLVEVLRRAIN